MADVIRAALVQTSWTGDKESMIKAHEEYARQAAEQGAQVMCFQELFYGPYFCQVQDAEYYSYAESIPGPDDRAVPGAGRRAGHGDGAARCTRRSSPACSTTPPRWSTPTAPTSASTASTTSPR